MSYKLYRRDSSPNWHAYFVDRDGKRQRCSTKQADKRRAAIVADEWYRRLADPTYSAANATTLQVASKQLIVALVRAKRSKATTGHFYPTKLGHFLRLWGEDMSLARIDAKKVDSYIVEREQEGATPHTVSKELGCLRMLLKHARRRGEFSLELSQVMPIGFASGYVPRTRRLTIEEARAFIAELPPNVARYVAFVLCTTARDAAVARARGRHWTPSGIEVYDLKTKGSARTVPIVGFLAPFVGTAFQRVEPDQALCPGIGSVRHAFGRAAKRLGMAHVSPNDLRRSVAHWLLERGVPRDAAAAFMGHANTKMLDAVYGKLDTKELGASITRALGAGQRVEGSSPSAASTEGGFDSRQASGVRCPAENTGNGDGLPEEQPLTWIADEGLGPRDVVLVDSRKFAIETGSSVDGSWKTEAIPVDSVETVDAVSAGNTDNTCAGTESNRRHGDFQSLSGAEVYAGNDPVSPCVVAYSWKESCLWCAGHPIASVRDVNAPGGLVGLCKTHHDEWTAQASGRDLPLSPLVAAAFHAVRAAHASVYGGRAVAS